VTEPSGPPEPADPPTDVLPRAAATGAVSPGRPRPDARTFVRGLVRRARAQAPLLVVLGVLVIAFVRIGLQHWREGTTELGLALLLGAVLRAACTERGAGLLVVRERWVDVLTYAAFGLVVMLVSLTITGGPLAGR